MMILDEGVEGENMSWEGGKIERKVKCSQGR